LVNPVRKAVFPVAGLGTRFLPATKATPKEMLTVVDRPVLQYVVDEAREAGIEHLIFVTGRNKAAIEDHFDVAFELEARLRDRGKLEELDELTRGLPPAGTVSYTRQQTPLGLGHAIWCARDIVGTEPFAVLLPDMLMHSTPGCLKQMLTTYERHGGNVVAVEAAPWEDVHRYGIVSIGEEDETGFRITGMVEKPKRSEAPSNLYISGRYILQPEIFALLGQQSPGAGGEIQITDAMRTLAETQPFTAFRYRGRTYDCGTKTGFLLANVAYALAREDIGPQLRGELTSLLGDEGA
jgi:UTP--glucose-1-phosphate uridylyltransferase